MKLTADPPTLAPRAANDTARPMVEDTAFAAAFALAPIAPFIAMARAQWQAQQALLASQAQWSILCTRALTDAWRVALRRQYDAALGISSPSRADESETLRADSEALQAAADQAREAGRSLAAAQARAWERVRASA
jgi:glycerol-3-phosphate O-acyltransferase